MSRASHGSVFLLGLMLAFPGAAQAQKGAQERTTRAGADFFEKEIRPILVQNCYSCHSGDPKKAKGGFLLDTREGLRKGGKSGAVISPGRPEQSLLIEAVQYESLEMPPKGKLPDELIEKLVEWVTMGAPDPRTGKAARTGYKIDIAEGRKFWSFQPLRAAPAPKVRDTAWPVTDIDRFVRARQETQKLRPVADADRVSLIRRVSFDLTGLPPTPAEIDAFVADKSATAFAAVVDRLLASPHFGERWGRHWLDVVRYGESTGKQPNLPYRYAWRYRNYVIDSFNADKPYNRFILEQLAGDLLPAKGQAERDQLIVATGFLSLGSKDLNQGAEQYLYDEIDDQIDVTSRAFLGLTVACARCHDHKYDPIPQADYYALAGIFRSTETLAGLRPGRKVVGETKLVGLAQAKSSDSATATADNERRAEIAALEKHLDDLREQLKKLAVKPPPMKKKAAATPRVDPKQIREEIKTLTEKLDKLETPPLGTLSLAMGAHEGRAVNSPLLIRGELKDKGPVVPRGVLTVMKTPDFRIDPAKSGRLALAQWIAGKDNPLTARVLVNRVWQHLFGQGLVSTVDNFGAMGEEPTDPRLLDTLAVRFMNDDQWSIKKLIRSIVLSRVYQLGSGHDAANYTADPSNKFLWRMERRRLDAEEIRDAILAASGQLIRERPEGSPILNLDNGIIRPGKVLFSVRKPTNHRAIYLPVLRGVPPEEVLKVFDVADPSLIVGQRDVTTVAPQALFMMNDPFVMVQATTMAQRLLATPDLSQDGRIDLAYRLALGRSPNEHERAAVKSYLPAYRKSVEAAAPMSYPVAAAWASFCQILFASGEFRTRY
ncbi:MAG TPA: PSD1 and planctomycete cytochrome C domain-containing protein [Gemmataceae bacterium]|nr:PSD1 and planctomycete cytochrome C domain-containing protein [Gemmataceae bacterium]